MNAKKPTMIELADARRDVIEKIIVQGGEILPEDETALAAADLALDEKAEAYLAVMDRMEAASESAMRQAEMTVAYAASCKKAVDSLKNRLKTAMTTAKTTKIKAGFRNLSVREGAFSMKVVDEKKIPMEFITENVVTQIDIDKAAAKKRLMQLHDDLTVAKCAMESTNEEALVAKAKADAERIQAEIDGFGCALIQGDPILTITKPRSAKNDAAEENNAREAA